MNNIALAGVFVVALALPLAASGQTQPAAPSPKAAPAPSAPAAAAPKPAATDAAKPVKRASHRVPSKADARVCLEFPNTMQVIKCAEKYRYASSGDGA
jgi:hypothetical protein